MSSGGGKRDWRARLLAARAALSQEQLDGAAEAATAATREMGRFLRDELITWVRNQPGHDQSPSAVSRRAT